MRTRVDPCPACGEAHESLRFELTGDGLEEGLCYKTSIQVFAWDDIFNRFTAGHYVGQPNAPERARQRVDGQVHWYCEECRLCCDHVRHKDDHEGVYIDPST